MIVETIDRVHINGLPLPAALVRAIGEGRWRCPPGSVLRRVFREPPVRATLYDLAVMRVENRSWLEQRDPAFLGHSDDKTPPGDIDPARSLLLGALGPDMPFALDFRDSLSEPRVLYLHTGGDRWITIARDVEDLLAGLRLNGRPAAH
jgi:hypothetical protein